jgi:hypothetical protein
MVGFHPAKDKINSFVIPSILLVWKTQRDLMPQFISFAETEILPMYYDNPKSLIEIVKNR